MVTQDRKEYSEKVAEKIQKEILAIKIDNNEKELIALILNVLPQFFRVENKSSKIAGSLILWEKIIVVALHLVGNQSIIGDTFTVSALYDSTKNKLYSYLERALKKHKGHLS